MQKGRDVAKENTDVERKRAISPKYNRWINNRRERIVEKSRGDSII